jgi:enamine deaminase RidA (YjgF/YER057c/UK114 family)
MAETKAINPWTWQEPFNFSQAVEASGPRRLLVLAGQTSADAHGNVLHAGDMAAQLEQVFDNLEAVLAGAGMTMANVVRLNYYVTDVQAFVAAQAVVAKRLASCAVKPAGTLLGVASLFHPDAMVEMEATAVD